MSAADSNLTDSNRRMAPMSDSGVCSSKNTAVAPSPPLEPSGIMVSFTPPLP